MPTQFALFSQRTLLPQGSLPATVFIKNGKIEAIEKGKVLKKDYPLEDVGEQVLMAGVIDPHVHINEPGRTDWEGFDTATKAAAAGGITTLVDMPLNSSPVTTTVAHFKKKSLATKGKLHVNCGFWGGLVPQNSDHLPPLIKNGVLGIKAFLTHSGIDEFPNVTEADLQKAMPEIAKSGLPLLVHCELEQPNLYAHFLKKSPTSYQAYLQSRPKNWENAAIELMIKLCRTYQCRTHIVHLSSAEALPMIAAAKAEGLPLTVETCPQYLFFDAETIPDADTRFKCAPPIREKANNEQLWKALESGLIDFVATDHSPAPPTIKQLESGNFQTAWGGIAGLQFLLPVVWTAARKRGVGWTKIGEWLSQHAADFIGMGHRKGVLKVGYDADLVVWNPEATFKVTEQLIQHRHKITPYLGQTLYGVVAQTYVGGAKVFENGRFLVLQKGKLCVR